MFIIFQNNVVATDNKTALAAGWNRISCLQAKITPTHGDDITVVSYVEALMVIGMVLHEQKWEAWISI